jgi:hypothetical protein
MMTQTSPDAGAGVGAASTIVPVTSAAASMIRNFFIFPLLVCFMEIYGSGARPLRPRSAVGTAASRHSPCLMLVHPVDATMT